MPSLKSAKLKLGSSSKEGVSGSASVSSAAKSTAKSIKSAMSLRKKKKKDVSDSVSFDDGGFGAPGEEPGSPTNVGFGSSTPRFMGGGGGADLSPIKTDGGGGGKGPSAAASVVSGTKSKAASLFRKTPKDKGPPDIPSMDEEDSVAAAGGGGIEDAVPGDYLVQVHIIEVRDLKPSDPDGSADPYVSVAIQVGDSKKDGAVTRTVVDDRNAIFDETFRFEFPSCKVSEIEMAVINVTVMDSDVLIGQEGKRGGRGDVIGSWEAELFDGVYARRHHEFYRQFVVLTNPEENDASAQGFLRLSVTVLGPHDRMPHHDLMKERDDEVLAAGDGLSPMQLGGGGLSITSTELRFIMIDVHEIIDVPYYKFEYAKRLYVQAELGRFQLKTSVAENKFVSGINIARQQKDSKSVLPTRKFKINERIIIAVIHPTMARSLRLSVWESRSSRGHGDSRCVACLDIVKIDYIMANSMACFRTTLPFYGAPLLKNKYRKGGKTISDDMNHAPDTASTFRGQLVVTMRDVSSKRNDGSERPYKSFVEKLPAVTKRGSGGDVIPEHDTELHGEPEHNENVEVGLGGEPEGSDTLSIAPSIATTVSSYGVMNRIFTLKSQIIWGCNLPIVPGGGGSVATGGFNARLSTTTPRSNSSTNANPLQYMVRISIGKHYVETDLMTPGGTGLKSSPDMCDWRSSGIQLLTFSSPFNLSSNDSSLGLDESEHSAADQQDDEVKPPQLDVIVTLLRGHSLDYSSSSGKVEADKNLPLPICYRRIPASELLLQSAEQTEQPMAKWIHLKEDKAIDALHDTVFPGSILIRMGMYPCGTKMKGKKATSKDVSGFVPSWECETSDDPSGSFISPNILTPSFDDSVGVDVRVNVYSAQDLPPADLCTGALDPYLICSLGGRVKRTSIKTATRNPSWFETLVFHTRLPRSRDLWPELILQLWDADEGSNDDFVGNLLLSLKDVVSSGSTTEDGEEGAAGTEILPTWRDIFFQEPGDIAQGSVLLGVECVVHDKKGGAFDFLEVEDDLSELPLKEDLNLSTKMTTSRRGEVTTEKFHPQGAERTVEILALGCRDLRSPSSIYGMKAPMLSFQIGDSKPVNTPPSSRPSAKDCNFGVKLHIDDVYLPDDDQLAPFLQVKVLDGSVKFKSFHSKESIENGKRIVGTGSLCLKHLQYYQNLSVRAKSIGATTIEDIDSVSSSEPSVVNTQCLIQRPYNKKRLLLDGELEVKPVYDVVDIYRGKPNEESETSRYDLEQVGRLHVFVRILDPTDGLADTSMWDILTKQLTSPTRYDIHVYILKANNLPAKDSSGTSDAYVRLRIGEGKGRRANEWVKGVVKKNTLFPEFYERFDLSCKIPGDTRLEVQVLDRDEMIFDEDDLIGSTKFDLDRRLFSKEWHAYGIRKPTETRCLWHPTSRQPQGELEMWVDIVEAKDKTFPVWDIRQPPEEEFEVRIVVWKVENIPPGDEFTDQSDLFVKLKLGNHSWQSTDTHLFAKNGKGSFNYRIKFPLKLREGGKVDGEGAAKLKIQVWDADILINDILCVTQMNLGRAFQNAWIMKDSGVGYQHLGNIEEQLKVAVAAKKRNEKDNEEERLKDIPINWRHDPDGFLAGGAEKYTNFMGAWSTPTGNDPTEDDPNFDFEQENEENKTTGIKLPSPIKLANPLTPLNPLKNLFGKESGEQNGEQEPLLKKGGDIETGDTGDGAYESFGIDEYAPPEETPEEKRENEIKKMRQQNEEKKKKKMSLQNQVQENLGLKTPENSKWIYFPVTDMESGETTSTECKILLSIEILPKELADCRRCGDGRDEPNAYPVLPPPEGRVELLKMLYNPIYAVRACLGDTIATKLGVGCLCALVTAGCLAIGVVFGPEIQITLQILTLAPPIVDNIIYVAILLLAIGGCVFCYWRAKKRKEESEYDDADDYDDEEDNIAG